MNQNHPDVRAIALPHGAVESVLSTNKVIRNTYLLLSLTLVFAACATGVSAALKLPHPGILLTLVGYFGLLFGIHKLQDSGWSVALVFVLTGFMGYTLGPIISRYLGLPNGGEIVMQAMGATAAIFVGLSAYALTTRKDFSFMGGFLMIGILVAFLASLAAIFFAIPALALTVSAAFVLLMSGLILYETSNIIRGGETNYVLATVALFVSIFNLFTSLLQLLGFANSSD
ncbi:MAG TPA: Bax inhibitor-1/YccA family protein [Accumulibacter sp.]|uniref:Bax inhibitor-1/YccA family protein n=1 Tax=Accumulibacter sp. TaxID=2053492 RepID=UPI0025F14D6B|nr:Bax inhibitor-1/YccA family protein [Accumulibacter sp.]MCM8597906.1 Bax inhibitor-1/YccA family protein [Accumulibacter sp.]MCM8661768.1 Bax inhibitor-1/YccA family protein [Accumulibacter sp.]HNC51145.1 Bax inhibitor-1/YccA family protein [Accumulibacter sp.]